jgi:hypothetical protein
MHAACDILPAPSEGGGYPGGSEPGDGFPYAPSKSMKMGMKMGMKNRMRKAMGKRMGKIPKKKGMNPYARTSSTSSTSDSDSYSYSDSEDDSGRSSKSKMSRKHGMMSSKHSMMSSKHYKYRRSGGY